MRNIVVRSIRAYQYTVKAANINTSSVETITVNASSKFKNPESQLKKYMPEGYVFMTIIGEPVAMCEKRFMTTDDFMAMSQPYVAQDGDKVE